MRTMIVFHLNHSDRQYKRYYRHAGGSLPDLALGQPPQAVALPGLVILDI